MNQNIDLTALERQSWRSYHKDGLFDLFWGAMLVAAFMGAVTAQMVVLVALQLAAGATFQVAKRRITIPRMGIVQFGPDRRTRKKKTSAIMAVSAVVTVVLVAFTASRVGGEGLSLIERNVMVIGFGVWLLLVFAIAAYWMDNLRLFTMGGAVVLSLWAALFLDTPVGFLLTGVAFLAVGAVELCRFLRSYPIESEATPDDIR